MERWRKQRPALPPDLWIETIPYKGTREYVARVLAFSLIYDSRLNGDAALLGQRLLPAQGAGTTRRSVACAMP